VTTPAEHIAAHRAAPPAEATRHYFVGATHGPVSVCQRCRLPWEHPVHLKPPPPEP
jgi:hypothetical protein